MVKVKIRGGLGNQMFQYAYAKALQQRGYEVILDSSLYTQYKVHGGYGLDDYATDIPIFNQTKNMLLERIKSRIGWQEKNLIEESSLQYSEAMLSPLDNHTIAGYFQSEKYFLNIRELLLKQFNLTKRSLYTQQIEEQIKKSKCSCSVHIRRGDYLLNPETQKIHGVCGLSYYFEAIALLEKEFENINYFIFSDDINWVKENLHVTNAVYIESEEERIAHEDIYLMSLASHNIIANSSFSWWGAWLNQYEHKMVIAPKRWFADEVMYQQSHDIVCESWVKI